MGLVLSEFIGDLAWVIKRQERTNYFFTEKEIIKYSI